MKTFPWTKAIRVLFKGLVIWLAFSMIVILIAPASASQRQFFAEMGGGFGHAMLATDTYIQTYRRFLIKHSPVEKKQVQAGMQEMKERLDRRFQDVHTAWQQKKPAIKKELHRFIEEN